MKIKYYFEKEDLINLESIALSKEYSKKLSVFDYVFLVTGIFLFILGLFLQKGILFLFGLTLASYILFQFKKYNKKINLIDFKIS